MNDPINPSHYTQHPSGVECIEITQHMSFCVGNAVKYCWRAGEKADELEDLKKAVWYAKRILSTPYLTQPTSSSWDVKFKHQLHLFLAMEEDSWRREAIRALAYNDPHKAIQFIERQISKLERTAEVV